MNQPQALFLFIVVVASVSTADVGVFWEGRPLFQTQELPYFVRFAVPKQPGTYTPIVFSTGFASVIPPAYYSDFEDRLAGMGYVVMSLFALQTPDYSKMATETGTCFEWLKTQGQSKIESHGYKGVTVDWDRFVLLSHSASGHVYAQRLSDTCSDAAKVLILLDPVDGFDPFGIIHDNIVPDPPATLPFIMPTLIIATHKSDQGAALVPACTDPKLSNLHFYNGLAGPTWFVRFEEYGHADLLNSPLSKLAPVCGGCSNCVFKLNDYHQATADLIDTFVKGILDKKSDAIDKIQNPESLIPGYELFHEYDLHGYDPMVGGYCKEEVSEAVIE